MLYIVIYYYILLYIIICCYILLYIVIYCYILLCIVIYCYMFLYIVIYGYILLYIVISCYILFYIVIYCYILFANRGLSVRLCPGSWVWSDCFGDDVTRASASALLFFTPVLQWVLSQRGQFEVPLWYWILECRIMW